MIEVENLSKQFGKKTAVDHLSFLVLQEELKTKADKRILCRDHKLPEDA